MLKIHQLSASDTLIDSCMTSLKNELQTGKAILIRGANILGAAAFSEFLNSLQLSTLQYQFASTPRKELLKGIYTSTEYSSHQTIPLHHENSYSSNWPSRIWFHCVTPAGEGGNTPIADGQKVYEKIDPSVREEFENRGLLYVRNYSDIFDLPWQKVFHTNDRNAVENYCKKEGIYLNWKRDGGLQTRNKTQVTKEHRSNNRPVWFNQAHLYHVSNLGVEVMNALLDSFSSPFELPRNAFYGDGGEIDIAYLDHIRQVLNSCKTIFPWAQGDILCLDNSLIMHGRTPFKGQREVLVAMTN